MDMTHPLGAVTRHGDQLDVRFERHYPRPVTTVWSALTEPARLADWMGVSEVEPRVGGRFDMMIGGPQPMTGRVRIWEPPAVLEFSWSNADAPESVVRYELTPDEGGTRLVFTQKDILYSHAALMLPGWHTLFARLGKMLAESEAPEPGWRALQGIYIDHYQLRDVLRDVPATPSA